MAYESNKLRNVNILSYYNNFMGGGNTSLNGDLHKYKAKYIITTKSNLYEFKINTKQYLKCNAI